MLLFSLHRKAGDAPLHRPISFHLTYFMRYQKGSVLRKHLQGHTFALVRSLSRESASEAEEIMSSSHECSLAVMVMGTIAGVAVIEKLEPSQHDAGCGM